MRLVKHSNGEMSLRTQAKSEFKSMLLNRFNEIDEEIIKAKNSKLPQDYINYLETQKLEVNLMLEELK